MKDLSIFISSSDSYKDCWVPFFKLFKKFWPDCQLPIYLNTEKEQFSFEGLEITSTCVGKHTHFGETFHQGLGMVKTKYVLVIMIDYFFMATVDNNQVEFLFDSFLKLKFQGLYLVNQEPTVSGSATEIEGVYEANQNTSDRFSFQIAFWEKDILKKYVLLHETPWMSEKFGTKRAHIYNHKIGYVSSQAEPIKYLLTGGLHKGGWIEGMIPFFEKENIQIDFSKRGIYKWKKQTLLERIQAKRKRFAGEWKSSVHLHKLINDLRKVTT